MAAMSARESLSAAAPPRALHPLHAILLGFALPLFLGTLLSDLAYRASFDVQWANFASWLNAGGLLFSGFALLWALAGLLFGGRARRRPRAVYVLALVAMWAIGFINALVHSKDAWAVMPEGLYLSAVTALLALAAAWLGYSAGGAREAAR
jgi:uncharacterized membrane protein